MPHPQSPLLIHMPPITPTSTSPAQHHHLPFTPTPVSHAPSALSFGFGFGSSFGGNNNNANNLSPLVTAQAQQNATGLNTSAGVSWGIGSNNSASGFNSSIFVSSQTTPLASRTLNSPSSAAKRRPETKRRHDDVDSSEDEEMVEDYSAGGPNVGSSSRPLAGSSSVLGTERRPQALPKRLRAGLGGLVQERNGMPLQTQASTSSAEAAKSKEDQSSKVDLGKMLGECCYLCGLWCENRGRGLCHLGVG